MQYPTIAQPQYAFAPTMMSEGGLVPAARAVQSKGRGNDSMLVHMSPREVGGLQALAMQHGGSLTTNPQTGLPEAGFLENILPTVLGFALTPFMGPLAAGLTVGGIQTVRTGDLGQGLLAGLGAYGGANLAGSLTSAGAQQGVQAAGAAGQDLMNQAVTNPAMAVTETGAQLVPTATTPQTIGDIYRAGNAQDALLARSAETLPASVQALPTPTGVAPSISSQYAQMGRGLTNLVSSGETGDASRAVALQNLGGYSGLAKTAGMAAAPALLAPPEPYKMPEEEKSEYEGPYTPTRRQVSYPGDELRRRTSEFMYFNPSNPIPFAEGGETASGADISVSPNEAKVYQDIMNVQRLAGLPALDPNRFAVMPGRSYEQFVYNPIETGPSAAGVGPERDYGFAPLMIKKEAEGEKNKVGGIGGVISRISSRLKQNQFAKGGVPMLEDGGFVLTKKAVDGLGKGSNKKGQKAASRGLGAIPIKGPGTGTSDSIKTSIEGKRPALVSNGEAYVPKKQVAKHGGAKKFYALMKKAERRA
jgi:hypothetical protein